MDCRHFQSLLDRYLEGVLSAQELLEAEEHLVSCPACRFRLKVSQDCRTLNEEDEVPVSFTEGYRQQVIKEEAGRLNKKQPRLARWIAVAAALVFVAGGTILAGQSRRAGKLDASLSADGVYAAEESARGSGLGTAYAPAAAPMADLGYAESAKRADAAEPAEKIIRTVQMEITTRVFDQDYAALQDALEGAGGRVQDASVYVGYAGLRTAYLTLRVPSSKLDALAASFKAVGRLVSFSESSEDVSEQYSDTANRLRTQQTKMERLQALLAKAENIEDLIAIETGISDTQYEIDRLTGLLRGLDSKVDYSTLNVTLNELSAAETSQDKEESLPERIRNGMAAAWEGFTYLLGDLAVFLTVVLPYLIALALIVLIIRLIIKRRKK